MNTTLDFMHDGGAKVFEFCGLKIRNDRRWCEQKDNFLRNDGSTISLKTRLSDNGFYFAKDFGGGVKGYNAITLLANFAGVDNKEAYKRILKLYNVDTDLDSKDFDNSLELARKKRESLLNEAKSKELEKWTELENITFYKDLLDTDKKYLKEKGNIDFKIFSRFARPVRSITTKTVYANGSEYVHAPKQYTGLCWAIDLGFDTYRIIYKGKTRTYKKGNKTITEPNAFTVPNLNRVKEQISENYEYSLGINELEQGKDAILVGGEMDFFAMKSLGFNVFTLGAEKPNMTTYTLELLASKEVGNISVCYDTDYTGLYSMNQLYRKYNYKPIYLPKLDRQEWSKEANKGTYQHAYSGKKGFILNRVEELSKSTKPKNNDICDYYQLYRFDSIFLNAFDSDKSYLQFDKKLSEYEKLYDFYTETLLSKKTIWQVPTASGKTTVACNTDFQKFGSNTLGFYGFVKQLLPNAIFVYAAPLTTIVEELKETYPNFQVICEGQENSHKAQFVDTITTYNSLPNFLLRLKQNGLLKDVVLVVDEIHEAIQSSGYQNIAEFQSIFDMVSHTIGMSATIGNIKECFNDFNILRCERLTNPNVNINLHIVEESNLLDTTMKIAQDNKEKDVIYFRNSKKVGAKANVYQIKEALQLENINCDVLTGGMRLEEKRNNVAYQSLIKTNKLPKECNHLVATSVLSTGVTAYVDKIVYIANRTRDITAFMQSYARDRSDNIDVELILVREKTEKRDTKIDLNINYLYSLCQKSARQANKMKLANDFYYKENPELKLDVKTFIPNNLGDDIRKFVYFDRFTDKFEVNRYKMFNERYKDYCKNMGTKTYIDLIQELVPNCQITIVEDKSIYEKSEQVSEILVNQKQLLASDNVLLTKILKDETIGNPIAEYVFFKTDSDKVKDAVKNYSYLSSFYNVGSKKDYLLHSDLTSCKPKLENPFNEVIQELIEKRTELERKINVATSQKSIDKYSKTLYNVQSKLDSVTKDNEFLAKYENENLIEVVKRNFEHLQVFFSRFNALKRNLMNAIPFEQLVDVCMDTNATNYGLLTKQLYHNAAVEVYEIAKENKVVLSRQDNFLEQKFEEIELDLEVINFVSQKECSVNDFLKKFKFKGYTEKNFKRKLGILFTDIDISTLFIRAKRLDLSLLIGEQNAKNYINNFKSSLPNG